MTTPGAMVLVGAVRIWYVCTSPEAAAKEYTRDKIQNTTI